MSMSSSEAGKLGGAAYRMVAQQQRQQRIEEYEKAPRLCLFCESPLAYDKKRNRFCSKSCSASYNNRDPKKYLQRKDRTKSVVCLFCGGSMVGKSGKKYCSEQCQFDQSREETRTVAKRVIEIGERTESPAVFRYIKKMLLMAKGHKCENCQYSIWLGQNIPLELDHIDGNHQNNSWANLRLLCPNCHALTPTYKSKNLGKGRAKRRERYRQGKSY